MRYFWKREEQTPEPLFGKTYPCPNHPLYNSCTLYKTGTFGLAVIQQRWDKSTKTSRWGPIDPELVDDIYQTEGFQKFFLRYSGHADGQGIYPTVAVRQIMWALRMKPLPRQRWETVFDHKPV